MLELDPILFVGLHLLSLFAGFGAGIAALVVVYARLSRNLRDVCEASNEQIQAVSKSACGIMSQANAESARQLGYLGEAMENVIQLQQRQVAETYQRNAALTHMLVVGSGKHDRAVADMILTGGPSPSYVTRPGQHILPKTRKEEAAATTRRRQERIERSFEKANQVPVSE